MSQLLLAQMMPCGVNNRCYHQGLYSLSGRTSYCKNSLNIEAARLVFRLFSIALKFRQQRCQIPVRYNHYNTKISLLRDFTRFGDKTSYCLVNSGSGSGNDLTPVGQATAWTNNYSSLIKPLGLNLTWNKTETLSSRKRIFKCNSE